MKLLASDYDQTFYLNDSDIAKNIEEVKIFQKKGNIFVIATGRSYYDFYHKLDIYHFPYDYVILNHGAIIMDNKDNVLKFFTIDNDILRELEKELELDKCVKYFCTGIKESRLDFKSKDLTKISVTYNTKKEAVDKSKVINKIFKDYVYAYNIMSNSIEIVANSVSKKESLLFLIQKLNVDKSQVYTIGDSESDIEMISNFNGYSMEESSMKVKEISIKSVKSVSELIKEIK